MIHKLEPVILVKDYPDQGLVKGDMGAVVMVHDGGKAFEVEFVTLAGDTLGVLTRHPECQRYWTNTAI